MTAPMKRVLQEKKETWPQILRYNYAAYRDRRTALRHKLKGVWRPYTWEDYYINVKHLALGLLSLGFGPEDKVIIVGDNAPQWYYAELATQANHGVSVGVYSELTSQEIKYIAQNSEARFAIVEDQEQVDKFLQIKGELPFLKKIIYWSYKGLSHYDDPLLMGYREVLQLGQKYEEGHPHLFEQNVQTGRADEICAIVYTSGTTGAPRGAVHTYETMKASADCVLQLDPWHEDDNVVPSLPPAWITEQWFAIGCHLLSAAVLNFFEKPETQQQDTREIGPNVVFYGARLWEKQASEVQARILETDVIKGWAYRLLMPIGYKMAGLRYKKQKPNLIWKTLYILANGVLFRHLRDSLGLSKARICYNTGAMLSPEAFRFYHALNLPLKSLYGTTEGGVVAGAMNEDIRLETVGPVHDGAEIKISNKGELLCRHPGIFAGYYKDTERTAEVLKDGWFCSGDSGFIREDGHVVVIDRLKDIIHLDSGDKLAPQLIEARLRFSPYIKDAWVLAGADGAYASAVIVIDYGSVGRWAGQKGIAYRTFTELSQKPEVYQLVKSDIDRINQDLPAGARVQKYLNLYKEFDPEEGELTRTRNLRRAFLKDRYRELIRAVYNNKPEVPIEVEVKSRNGEARKMKTIIRIESVEGDD